MRAWVCALALLAAAPLMADKAAEMYQQALAKEKGEGDFGAAIELYKKVVKEAEDDSLLAARARLRLGLCEEKAGLARARAVYDQVGGAGETPAAARLEAEERLLSNQSRQAQLAGEEAGGPGAVQRALAATLHRGVMPTEEWRRLQEEIKELQDALPQQAGPEMEVHVAALKRAAEQQRRLQNEMGQQQEKVRRQILEQQEEIERQVVIAQQRVQAGSAHPIVPPAAFNQQLNYLKNGWVDDFRLSIEQAKIDDMLAQAAAALWEGDKAGEKELEKHRRKYEKAQREFDLGKTAEETVLEAEAAYEAALGKHKKSAASVYLVDKALEAQRRFIERLAARTDHAGLGALVENIARQRESLEGLAGAVESRGNMRQRQLLKGHRRLLDDLQGIAEKAAARPSFTVPYPHTFLGKLPEVWKYSRSYPGMAGQAIDPATDDSGWMDIYIDHAPGSRWGGGGTAWYRTTVDRLEADASKPVHLAFAGVNSELYVFVNGRFVGEQHRWGKPFVLDVTPAFDFGGENTVALCLVSEGGQNYPRGEMFLLQPDTAGADYLLANRGGGLYGMPERAGWRGSEWQRHFSGAHDGQAGRKTRQRFKSYAEAPVSLPFAYRVVGEVPRRWRFRADDEGANTPELNADFVSADFDHGGWAEINVGQAWEDQGYDGYDEGAWYRTRFTVEAKKGEPVFLAFGGVDRDAWVYVNGELVGNHHAWNRPFHLDISRAVDYDGQNTVAVRVWDGQGMGGVYGKVEVVQPDKSGRLSRRR